MVNKSYFLITLGPGLTSTPEGRIIVVEYPGFKIVDEIVHQVGFYKATHKGICGASLCPEHPSADFVATTEAEIILGKLAPLQITKSRSHPIFNDIHHTSHLGEKFYTANSGVDCVDILNNDLDYEKSIPLVPLFRPSPSYLCSVMREQIVRAYRRIGGSGPSYNHLHKKLPFANLQKYVFPNYIPKSRDMRVCDCRPHFLHPNHVFVDRGDILVTLLIPGVQLNLSTGEITHRDMDRPHDGIIWNSQTVFTECVTSNIVCYEDSRPPRRITVVPDGQKGFLRGIAQMEDRFVAGLSARRGNSFFPQARLAVVDASSEAVVDGWNVPKELGRQVFSVINVTESYS
ncbi:MAG: hypothetical protein VXZ82_23635 [Planctomycetota bacterium]|nr:hypothetical protein [Planctomycetota bacterium]